MAGESDAHFIAIHRKFQSKHAEIVVITQIVRRGARCGAICPTCVCGFVDFCRLAGGAYHVRPARACRREDFNVFNLKEFS